MKQVQQHRQRNINADFSHLNKPFYFYNRVHFDIFELELREQKFINLRNFDDFYFYFKKFETRSITIIRCRDTEFCELYLFWKRAFAKVFTVKESWKTQQGSFAVVLLIRYMVCPFIELP